MCSLSSKIKKEIFGLVPFVEVYTGTMESLSHCLQRRMVFPAISSTVWLKIKPATYGLVQIAEPAAMMESPLSTLQKRMVSQAVIMSIASCSIREIYGLLLKAVYTFIMRLHFARLINRTAHPLNMSGIF